MRAQVETIIQAALMVLETQGMRFLEPGSRKIMQKAGADIDEPGKMVRIDHALVEEKAGAGTGQSSAYEHAILRT